MKGYAAGLEDVGAIPREAPSLPARAAAILEREPFLALVLALDGILLLLRLPGLVAPDTWLGVVGGREVAAHWLPRHDTLTVWAQGRDWVDQQWLGQLVIYGIHSAGGLRLLLLVNLAALVWALGLAMAVARRKASSRSVAVVGAFGALIALPNTVVRTQTIAFLLFVALFSLLVREERRPSWQVFLALPLLVLWANVHGSALLGAGLVVLWSVARLLRRDGRTSRRLRAVVLAALAPLCLLASPYAFDLPGYYRGVLSNDMFGRVVVEWRSPAFSDQWPFFVFAIAAIWLTACKAKRLSLFEHLALIATLIGGLEAVRNIVWFALVAVMVVPRALDGILPPAGRSPLRPRVNLVLSLVSLLAIVMAVGATASRPASWYTADYPSAAADAVAVVAARDPSLRVFSNEQYSDWLLWAVPGLGGRVAFDSRFELLSDKQLGMIYRFRNESGPDWIDAARLYRLLVLDPTDEEIAMRAVLKESGTIVLYRDGDIAVLLRRANG